MKNQLSKIVVLLILFMSVINCKASNDEKATTKITAQETTTETSADISKFAIERESKLNFKETVDSLSVALKTGGWKISATHNIEHDLMKSGQTILPVMVLELCNPKYSGKMLLVDDMRYLSVLMPCRVSVYEKSNGKTYITLMNSIEMAKMIGGPIEEQIKVIQEEIDQKILPFLK
ncbi:MAG: DUF302 domain-containing protein [Bacteroidales bacterium]|nr:DUF302 domain-containing protein [Bacteroidales bacterium]